MRQIEPREVEIINFLAEVGSVQVNIPDGSNVWVVNPEMRSIRAEHCSKKHRLHSVAQSEFSDHDGVPVVATLLLTEDGKFGELDFWKVNDQPLISLPNSNSEFRHIV